MLTWNPPIPDAESLRDAAQRAAGMLMAGEDAQVLIGEHRGYPFVHFFVTFPLLDRGIVALGIDQETKEVLVISFLMMSHSSAWPMATRVGTTTSGGGPDGHGRSRHLGSPVPTASSAPRHLRACARRHNRHHRARTRARLPFADTSLLLSQSQTGTFGTLARAHARECRFRRVAEGFRASLVSTSTKRPRPTSLRVARTTLRSASRRPATRRVPPT